MVGGSWCEGGGGWVVRGWVLVGGVRVSDWMGGWALVVGGLHGECDGWVSR